MLHVYVILQHMSTCRKDTEISCRFTCRLGLSDKQLAKPTKLTADSGHTGCNSSDC